MVKYYTLDPLRKINFEPFFKKRINFFSYDVIFSGLLVDIVKQFKKFNARIVFSAEEYCWPDKSYIPLYPPTTRGKRYLNSGGFIGYASDLYAILSLMNIEDSDDDQLYYTRIYVDPELREKYQIKLDHRSQIFENLNGAIGIKFVLMNQLYYCHYEYNQFIIIYFLGDVELRFKGNEAYLQNTLHNTVPLIIHGNGQSKLTLNYLGNYLAKSWNQQEGCISCWYDTKELPNIDQEDAYPLIVIAVFIEKPTPFLEEFLTKIYNLHYPKSKLYLFLHNNVPYHEDMVKEFLEKHEKEYQGVKKILSDDDIEEVEAKNLAMFVYQIVATIISMIKHLLFIFLKFQGLLCIKEL